MYPALTRRTLLRVATASALGLSAAALAACTLGPAGRAPTGTGAANPTTSTGAPVPTTAGNRILLAYFSRAGENYFNGGRTTLEVGNTEVLAGMISDRIDCDVYRIEAAEAYSDRYDPTVQRNVQEQNTNARPAIANPLPDLSGYDTVLLGSPIWNIQPPMIMASFVDAGDLAGKTLLPFVTYAVSGLGSTGSFYRDLNTGAELRDGLAVRGEEVAEGAPATEQWLASSGLN